MMTMREAKKERAKARARKGKVKMAKREEMMTTMNLLQLAPIVIAAQNVSRNLKAARQLRPAMTRATAIHHAKVLASGQEKKPRGIAPCLMRPAVATASAMG